VLEGKWRPILLVAIFAGLRASELRGLRRPNVDLSKREIHVRERADEYSQLGRPKSGWDGDVGAISLQVQSMW